MNRFTIFAVCALLLAAPAVMAQQQTAIRFNDDVRPVLSENCFACHGPDSAKRKARLRLDMRSSATANGAIIPGNAGKSKLIARITSDDPEVMMPPPGSGKSLSAGQKSLLARWIEEGAPWGEHWAFIKPQKGPLPRPVGADRWARNPIDLFVLAKLRKVELDPNEPADRYTLARRAALDLTGLPPDRALVESFLTDAEQGAYERYVDALLASPHAGEHRARYWLDAARYGDTHGMHVDNYREIWPYRDWVIGAFNRNMPFDQFVIEQIAGDLLPEATLQQRIATGFNRCNITTSEGGAIPEELDVRYMVDRVETTATVFLGLTAGCAVCHDHKYDPISQREFYSLGAYFNNTTQPAMDGNQKDTPPVVALPAAQFQQEWDDLQAQRKQLRAALVKTESATQQWWPSRERVSQHPIASDALVLWLPLAEGETEGFALPESAQWADDHPAGGRGVRFGEKGAFTVPLAALRSDEPLTVSFWFRTPDRLMGTTLLDQTTTKDNRTIGWRVTAGTDGAVTFTMLDDGGKQIRGLLPDNEALRPQSWQHVCVRYSGGQSNASIGILVNGRAAALRNSSESHIGATALAEAPLRVAGSLPTAGLSDIRIYRRWVSEEEAELLARDYLVNGLLCGDAAWDQLDRQQRDTLIQYHHQTAGADYQRRSRELCATQRRHDYIYARSTTTLVMQERPEPPRAWVLARGEYDKRGEEVSPGVPAVLPALPGGAPEDRLGLARWLVHPDHPLTARVTVNRLWQSLFGMGLVKTSEDFGVMGDRPSHPELLDWLAVEFVETGWDVKALLKLMVTSAAYRQSGVVTPEKVRRDPDNRFLSRGPRLRLDAEVLRDQALAVSGLLQRRIGGPSVRPYQPAGLWKVVAITGSNTREFQRDSGPALYRRSVYTFWKRTSPPPSMAAFNAPTREQCTVRRERTNTPLQAMVLMNDPQFVEAARNVAEEALRRHTDTQARATWILTNVLSHPGNKGDAEQILLAVAGFRSLYRNNPQAAEALVHIGDSAPDTTLHPRELAAWTMVANTLMNRDDFINK